MNFRNMTIGRKITFGFGITLVLLVVAAVVSYFGIGGIVNNAHQVIDGNKLDATLAQREVDHLNWVNKVVALITDEHVTKLDVQTDHTKCGFGKWLYGPGRKQAEALVPALKPLLKSIEDPHRLLHESAIAIDKVFKQPHPGLQLELSDLMNRHMNWYATVARVLGQEAGGMYSYQLMLRNAVQQAISIIKAVDADATLSLEEKKAKAMALIKEMRYGPEGKDYFWINDMSPRVLMHPFSPKLVGADVAEFKDPKGKPLFKLLVARVSKDGQGFVVYHWPRPGKKEATPKLSFGMLYKPWGWVVATGVYLDENNAALMARAKQMDEGTPFSLGVQTDSTKCALGTWLAKPSTQKLIASFPALAQALEEIKGPHAKLHESAIAIQNAVNALDMDKAQAIYATETAAALKGVHEGFKKAMAAEVALAAGAAKANDIYAKQTLVQLAKVQELLHRLRKTARDNIMTDEAMLNAAQTTQLEVSIIGAVAVVVGIILALLIIRGISKALRRVTTHMADGANQVDAASNEVSSSSQSLAEGAAEQAASLEETAASLEEMSSMTKANADNANQANHLMDDAKRVVAEANDSMKELKTAMDKINAASDETAKIIKTIDEIAFQTNLLALNAAVEAARAGEAGAGFAVVADEVRSLAMRAAEAAKSTSELIEGNLQNIKQGTELVTTTDQAFDKVAASAAKVAELVSEIASASSEQASGIDQVNLAASEMDKVTQQVAANAEETAAASEELSAQAATLNAMVAELRQMVDRGGRSKSKAAYKAAPTHKKPALLPAPKQAASTKKGKASPEDIIPMGKGDDAEFVDF